MDGPIDRAARDRLTKIRIVHPSRNAFRAIRNMELDSASRLSAAVS